MNVYALLAGAFLLGGALLVGLGLFARHAPPAPGADAKRSIRPMLTLGLALLAIGLVFAAAGMGRG